jgi:dolichol-phosphate mannosyltransferase
VTEPRFASMKTPRQIVVVVPTYNESGTIAHLLKAIMDLGPHYSALVVDDNSPDGTARIVDEIGLAYAGRITLLRRPAKAGIGRAYVAGFRRALSTRADLIATMDADLSHDPADLARLVNETEAADMVLGSRYVDGGSTEGWPLHRQILSRAGSRYARLVLGVAISDLTGGFKVYCRPALEALDLDTIKSDGYVFQIETTYKTLQSGFHIVEVPIRFVDRVSGKSKLSRRIVIEAMFIVWRLRIERLLSRSRLRPGTG